MRQTTLNRFATLMTLVFMAGCLDVRAGSADDNSSVANLDSLPQEVQQVMERLAACFHFGGEIGGDGSDRDKEVFAAMTELRCDAVAQDFSAVRQKYADKTVQAALDAAQNCQLAQERQNDAAIAYWCP